MSILQDTMSPFNHFVWLSISLFYMCCAEVIVETPPSNLQHPKHQPQDSDVNVILEKEQDDTVPRVGGEHAPEDVNSAIPLDDQKENASEIKSEEKHHTGSSKAVETSNEAVAPNGATEKLDEPVLANPVVLESKNQESVTEVNNEVIIEEEVRNEAVEAEELETDDTNEDVPLASFKEFREEQMEKEKETKKVEKRKTEDVDDSVVEKPKPKLIQKNYADNSCGSKIVDSKKEFKNSGTILNNNKDLYAMIPCEGAIWFVVELCDTIQINALQLANYELFSSSIKEFKVYTAETYPPKEWKHLGTFETVNSRQIQKFDIENHGDYSKYVRFEKITSRGKEHFCVLSTFEILGMSMVDEYEEVQHQQDEEVDLYEQPLDSDDPPDTEPTDKSLIQGAKDTVKNIVDSALNVLGVSKSEEIVKEEVVKNDTILSKDEAPPSSVGEEAVKPTEESVIIKVDEMGKEIKNEGVPEKRLKGEEDVADVSSIPPTVGTPDPPSAPDREAIMEAVDLSKHDEVKKPDVKGEGEPEIVVAVVQPISPDVKLESAESKPQEKIEKVPETSEPKPDGGASEKGVIMTNSPKKNSIFVELDKKIKELEKNLSLSNDYLETLSSRYKRVDQSFKPLQKTLSTIDEVMVRFEDRLQNLETKFAKFETALESYLLHMEDSKSKSNTLVTSTNLILFLLLIMLYFLWRMSYKVNQISYCVIDQPRESKATFVTPEISHTTDSNSSRKRQRSKPQKVTGGFRSRDTSPRPGLLSHKSESNLPKKMGTESKKSLESVQMDLIYPQQKSPILKRKAKHVR
ncbi:uncharacterized protein LOC134826678 [Bolinopsis microptera]|uniref:uncharacterized protein LOC134826678 n=1 Tax=Bolinopsis microptera TaxID=2820187 RepID=UPI003078CB03